MKQPYSISGLVAVISLVFSVIWLSPAFAVTAPTFTSLGQFQVEGLRVPGAMDMDDAGNLYVVDTVGKRQVYVVSPFGRLLRSFDLQASGSGLAITPDGARLYVARSQSVVIVDAISGAELGTLVDAESVAAEFGVTGEIDLDAAGNVFVVDAASLQIKVYNASGRYQTSFGGIGVGAGQFKQIGGMAISAAGQLVVADASSANAKSHVFSIADDLSLINLTTNDNSNFGSLFVPRGLAFDGQGRGYILDYMSNQVRVVDASFVSLGAYVNPGFEAGQLNGVADTIYDNENNRLFVGCGAGRIEILGVNGGQNPVRVNHAPSSPSPKGPIAGSEVASVNPLLTINNATDEDGDALTYKVVVTQDDAVVYQADVPAEVGETTTATVNVALAENETFSWTVQATDGEASSAVSAAATFVVNATEEAPVSPELSAPLNGESVDGLDTLTWSASTDPDPNDNDLFYQVEVALDEGFTEVVAAELLTDLALPLNSFATYGDLVDGVGYFWRVTARDDKQIASAPSNTGHFVYDTTSLIITANMPDAVVSFHGNHAYAGQKGGIAPVELRDVAPGTFSVVVERAGFEPFVAQMSLIDGQNVELYAELIPSKEVKNMSVSRNGVNGRSGLSVSGAAAPFLVDFDNDGALDLLVGDGSGQVTLFANLQQSGRNRVYLDNGVSLGLPVMPGAKPFVADWNNDGRKDLIIGQADGSVKLFINSGLDEAPAFGAGVDLQAGGSTFSAGNNAAPAVVDYNGDGAKDLLVGNASGQVLAYLNQGTDGEPALTLPVVVLQAAGAVVPFPVDWNADGQKDLLLTSGPDITVYVMVEGEYLGTSLISDSRSTYTGTFAIDLDGRGKQLLVGDTSGDLLLITGSSDGLVASFYLALQDKVDELESLVEVDNPELLSSVITIRAQIAAGDLLAAKSTSEQLAGLLAGGSARTSALQLAALCNL